MYCNGSSTLCLVLHNRKSKHALSLSPSDLQQHQHPQSQVFAEWFGESRDVSLGDDRRLYAVVARNVHRGFYARSKNRQPGMLYFPSGDFYFKLSAAGAGIMRSYHEQDFVLVSGDLRQSWILP